MLCEVLKPDYTGVWQFAAAFNSWIIRLLILRKQFGNCVGCQMCLAASTMVGNASVLLGKGKRSD